MNWKNILRWISVLPATVGGLLVGSITVGLLNIIQAWFIGASSDSGFIKIGQTLSFFAGGVLAVYWGSKVAPMYRKITSMVLFGLILIASVSVFFLIIKSQEFSYFWFFVKQIAFVFGAGYVVHQVYEEGEDFNLFK